MMKNLSSVLLIIMLLLSTSFAQQAKSEQPSSPVYWGGEMSLSFGRYFHIGLIPMIGYKVSPEFHLGGKVGYAYTVDKRYDEKIVSNNYGGSIFSRYMIIRGLYLHAEFLYWSYEYQTATLDSERDWVPFMLIGGGYVVPLSQSSSLFVEVLWDVIQDKNSPYNSAEPFVKGGIAIGL